MKRLELLLQEHNRDLIDLIVDIVENKCSYCRLPYGDCTGECKETIRAFLEEELIIDFDRIVEDLHCKGDCEGCRLQGKPNCKTLWLWEHYSNVL